jgi:hypothetical protein
MTTLRIATPGGRRGVGVVKIARFGVSLDSSL